jgi:hypothetical protein
VIVSHWLVVGLETGVFWPTKETRIQFRGRELFLRPETDKSAPDVITRYAPPGTYEEALRIVRQFLSSLAWVRQGQLREIGITGGSHPIHIGKGPGARLIDPQFRVDYLPDSEDPRARLALALYREALGLDNTAYQFLGFFKIINVLHDKGAEQKEWINKTIYLLEDHQAKERIMVLRSTEPDVGHYLYGSGRCAVAHAYSEPLVDPEDPEDSARLQKDLPLVKALAGHIIEYELGIKSMDTVWQEHLYQLDGFRTLVGSEIIAKLKGRREVAPGTVASLPKLSIRLRDQPRFASFESMTAEVVAGQDGCLLLNCHSTDSLAHLRLCLNFAEELLQFDAINGVVVADDGTPCGPRHAANRGRLMKALCLNGQLEVWDTTREALLGRTDPFIPENIDLGATVENLDRQIEKFERLAQEREAGESSAEIMD